MMIPDAWSKRSKTVPKNHQQLFNFLNSTIEPWDGPAAICATDAKWILAAVDRNGLRPLKIFNNFRWFDICRIGNGNDKNSRRKYY